MSPEQAEGGAADARSDIFFFGAILYEMLAGARAFPGKSAASVIGALLHRDSNPVTPPSAASSIAFKCLSKSPAARFQSASDLRRALDQASTDTGSIFGHRIRRHWLALTIAALLLLAIGFLLEESGQRRTESIPSPFCRWVFAAKIPTPTTSPMESQKASATAWPGSPASGSFLTVSRSATKARLRIFKRLATHLESR